MRRSLRALAWLVPVCAALTTASAATLDFPKPTGRVNDFANVLDEASRGELDALLAQLETDTTVEMAIATVTSLDGMSVEEYANRLFNEWGVGQADKDNGVLVLVAPTAREMRIEVGYGLEPILPDGLAGVIIRERFLPEFRNGNFQQGLLAGVRDIVAVVRKKEPVSPERLRALAAASDGPVTMTLPAWVLLPFIALPVAGGAYMLGVGAGGKVIAMLLIGAAMAGLGFWMAWAYSLWGLLLQVGVFAWVARIGLKKTRNPGFRAGLRDHSTRGGWVVGASGSSSGRSSSGGSSGGSSSFGDGSSGGGGASGRW